MQTSPQTYINSFANLTTSNDTDITKQKKDAHQKIYDGVQVGNQFIQYFYSSWMSNPDILITDNIIKSYTKIKHNDATYEGNDFVVFLMLCFTADSVQM